MRNIRELLQAPIQSLQADEIKLLDTAGELKELKHILGVQSNGNQQYSVGTITIFPGTGNQSITGVGFTPKFIRIQTTLNSASPGIWSDGSTDGTSTQCLYSYRNGLGNVLQERGTNLIYIRDGASITQIDLSSFDTNGFTLNKLSNPFAITLIYTCFG